jgi:hypothetical protein
LGEIRVRFLIRKVVVPIVLSVLYFVVVSPLALLLRIAGSDPMRRAFDRTAKSYRNPSPAPGNEQLTRTY